MKGREGGAVHAEMRTVLSGEEVSGARWREIGLGLDSLLEYGSFWCVGLGLGRLC